MPWGQGRKSDSNLDGSFYQQRMFDKTTPMSELRTKLAFAAVLTMNAAGHYRSFSSGRTSAARLPFLPFNGPA